MVKGETMEIISECTCENTMFTDRMCRLCLQKAKAKLAELIEEAEDNLSNLQSDFEQVEWHLDDTESVLMKNILDKSGIEYNFNLDGIGFLNKKDQQKAKKLLEQHDLILS